MSTSANASGRPDDDDGRAEGTPDGVEQDPTTDDVVDGVTSEEDGDEPDATEAADDVEEPLDGTAEADESADAVPAGAARARGRRPAADASRESRPAARRPERGAATTAPKPATRGSRSTRGPIAAISLFVRQVVAELRKVVTPTRNELGTYIAVVLVFVLAVMAYVGVLDFAFGRLVLWAFGG